jgi:putative PIN family toxin of toxin-antitoxin system
VFVVFDTNSLFSSLLSPFGKPAQLLYRYINGEFTLCVDQRILSEYETVLSRKKFNFDAQKIKTLLQFIRSHSLSVAPTPLDTPFIDLSDKKFYEVAKFCHAILITGNLKHFPDDPCIKSVQDF